MMGIRGVRTAWIGLAGILFLAAAWCDADLLYPDDMAVFEIEVTGETFRVGLTGEAEIARAEALLESGAENNIHGTLRRGHGGFNAPYSWHMDPATVTFPDLTMEVCDGRPESDVQSDVGYWVDTIKYYCPWAAKVVARVR